MIRPWQKIIINSLHVNGIALFPFVLIRKSELKNNMVFINHERIHLRQQIELLVIPFYLLYILNYLVNRMKYKTHDKAYRNICFEREAYQNEMDPAYLKTRRFLSWVNYIK